MIVGMFPIRRRACGYALWILEVARSREASRHLILLLALIKLTFEV